MHLGIGVAAFRSTLVSGGGARWGIEAASVSVSIDTQLARRWNLSGAAGAITGGWLTGTTERVGLGSGGVASVGVGFTALENRGAVPFVLLAASLSASATSSQSGLFASTDLRGSVVSGWTLWQRFTPYAVARVFGGPAFWRGETFGDQWHFQLGAGFILGLFGGFDLTAELIPLGEQRVTVGLGHTL